jgi:hypothetical protein
MVRVTQPLGQPPGISDGHLMHGGRDGSIRAHGQRFDGNRSEEDPGKPCGGKLALNADGRVWRSTPSQIGYRFGSGSNLRRRKSSRLLRQFGGTSLRAIAEARNASIFFGTMREFRMIRLRGVRHRYQSESCPFRDDMARRLRERGAFECRQGAGVCRTLYPPAIPNRTSELFHLSCS